MPFRVLHLADSHIGADLPVRGGGRVPRRGADFVTSYLRVLARAVEQDVDLVIHAGDLFDRPDPGQGAVAAATQPLWDLARRGIPIVIVPGNHERSSIPGALLLSHPHIYIPRQPTTFALERRGVRVAITTWPCLRRRAGLDFAAALAASGFSDSLLAGSPGATQSSAAIRILAVHETFAGARCGPANYRFRAGDDVIAPEAIPAGFRYIAAGHVHRHQVLAIPGQPDVPLVYAGSPDRITFAEAAEPKGAVLVTFADNDARPNVEFLEHRVRPMEVASFDVSGLSSVELIERVTTAALHLPEQTVFHVRLTGTATRGALRRLELTPRLRECRPDVLPTVSAAAVQWVPERIAFRRAARLEQSAFELLEVPPSERHTVPRADVRALPDRPGTYVLYDAAGRVLYVGKAVRLRSRIRMHLRGTSENSLRGWTRTIARVEVRCCASELEALLVEAELIRRIAPPFNRQMRMWERYCYLCETDLPHGRLSICAEPRGRFAFGPLRTRMEAERVLDMFAQWGGWAHCPPEAAHPRSSAAAGLLSNGAALCARYYANACRGPCAQRIELTAYEQLLDARREFLTYGTGPLSARLDAELAAAPTALAARSESSWPIAAPEDLPAELDRLRTRARQLNAARALLDRPFDLPGDGTTRLRACVTVRGLRIETSDDRVAATPGAPVPPARSAQKSHPSRMRACLPKPVADVLCTAVAAGACARC